MFLKVWYCLWGCGLLLPEPPLLITRFELLLQLLVHILPAKSLQALEKGLRAGHYLSHVVILPISVVLQMFQKSGFEGFAQQNTRFGILGVVLQRLLGTDADKVVVNPVFVQIAECKIGKLSRYGLPIRQRRQIDLTFYSGVTDLEILPVPGFRKSG